MGFSSWGIDISPIAVAVAQAKLAAAELKDILSLADRLIGIAPKHVPETPFFRKAFHPKTLIELCSLREGLLRVRKETGASILLRAAALGCLHGPLNKEEFSYFSNQMPRTFAPKPDYAVKFWKEQKLKAPCVKVSNILNKKLSRIDSLNELGDGLHEQVLCSNSQTEATFEKITEDYSLVITSPPYYGMRTYIQDQWLRMWFLGGPPFVEYEDGEQLDHETQESFVKSLARVWDNIYNSNSDRLDLHIRFGSVPSIKSDAREILCNSFEESGGWRIVYTRNASNADQGKRQAKQMAANSSPEDEFDFHVVRA
jgi:hypothetical protein